MERLLPRGRQWLIVPAVPMVMAGSHAMTSLPLAVTLHSGTTNTTIIAVGAIGTALFAVLLAYIVGLGVRSPWARPADATESPDEPIVSQRSPIGAR